MAKLNIDRNKLDHPEHFDDEIREFKSSDRYVPTPLERLLFELAGHRCTICKAPWLEIHHIDELSEGGETKYENLIALCPNCHTRVHHEDIPTKIELRQYKLKQEIAYELPILSRCSNEENGLIREICNKNSHDQIIFSKRHYQEITAKSLEMAVSECRISLGLFHLQESGIVSVDQDFCCQLADGKSFSINLIVRFTSKGIKWVRYLKATGRVPV